MNFLFVKSEHGAHGTGQIGQSILQVDLAWFELVWLGSGLLSGRMCSCRRWSVRVVGIVG